MDAEDMERNIENVRDVPEWAIKKLDEILSFTAPELRRMKLLALLAEVARESKEGC